MYRPQTRREWAFFGTLLAQAICIIALEVIIFILWNSWITPNIVEVSASYMIPIYVAVFITGSLYELLLAVDAIHRKNNLLVFAICLSNSSCLILSGMQYVKMHSTIDDLLTARDENGQPFVDVQSNIWNLVQIPLLLNPVIISLFTMVLGWTAYELHQEFAWAIYKNISAGSEMRARYLVYEVYLVVTKLDFYFIFCFIPLYSLGVVRFREPEFALTLALIPVSLIVLILGVYFVRTERMIPMGLVTLCHIAMIVYLLTRIMILCTDENPDHASGKNVLLLFAVGCLAFTLISTVCGIWCMVNFGRGLKHVAFEKKTRSSFVLHTAPRRIDLD